MNKTLLLFFPILFFLTNLSAQPFGNEWIRYDQTYFKFPIAKDGLYRIDYATLQNSGIPLSSVTGADFQVFGRGKEISVYVTSNDTFSISDYIEFYAQKNDGWFDSTLYEKKQWQGNDRVSLFTDTISYYLTWNKETNHLRIIDFSNSLTNHPAKENWCWLTSAAVYGGARNTYFLGKPAYQGQAIYNSDFIEAKAYCGTSVTHKADTKTLYTPYPYPSGLPAILRTQWMSRFPVPHNMEISMKSQLLEKDSYSGFKTLRMNRALPSNDLLTAGNTNVVFSAANSTEVSDANAVSYVELKYPALFNADNQTFFMFSLDASAENKYFEIYNFNESGTTPLLYDLTNGLRVTAIITSDTLKFQIPKSANERQLLLIANVTSGAIKTISSVTPVHFTDFSLTANQGDFIIISHPFFFQRQFRK